MSTFPKEIFPKLAAEFLGTSFFVFICASALLGNLIFQEYGALGIGLATGASLIAIIYAFSAISGSHLNPAVTLALWFAQKISLAEGLLYIGAQVLGGFTAAALLLLVFGQRGIDYYLGGPVISQDTSLQSAVVLEAIFASLWVFTYFATFVDKRGPVSFGALSVGLVVMAGTIVAGPISGAAFNPIKAIGPLALSGHVDSLMIWIAGPMVGSLVGIAYAPLFLRVTKKSTKS